MRIDKTITWGNIGAMVFPIITVIVIAVTMREDVKENAEDIVQLQGFNTNIGSILTAHTTSIAVHAAEIAGLEQDERDIKEQLTRMENKIDDL